MLISTECGGEGRNFEFCRRLVLFDLPWNPMTVEQRIGRLDRIGRDQPTEIVYFRPPGGFGRAWSSLYESLGLFREPLGGLERELRHVAREVEAMALDRPGRPAPRSTRRPSTRSWQRPAKRGRGCRRRRSTSCTAIPTGSRWPPGSSPGCRRISTS